MKERALAEQVGGHTAARLDIMGGHRAWQLTHVTTKQRSMINEDALPGRGVRTTRYRLAGAMEKARRQIATLVRECNTLLEILDELDYDRYFRGLMRVLSDEALSHLVRDDAALMRITDYTREKLADWHLPQWICSPDEQPLIVRACMRLEQLHRREGLEVAHPVFPFDRRSYCRVRIAFHKKWHRLSGFHLVRLFRNAGPTTNPLTDEQLRWIKDSSPMRFRIWQRGPRTPYEQVN